MDLQPEAKRRTAAKMRGQEDVFCISRLTDHGENQQDGLDGPRSEGDSSRVDDALIRGCVLARQLKYTLFLGNSEDPVDPELLNSEGVYLGHSNRRDNYQRLADRPSHAP